VPSPCDFASISATGVPSESARSKLEGIARTGSISQAAREMRMSYRRAWLLLEDLNVSFDHPVARQRRGPRRRRGS
jgi:molybdate transport repressor ModE-like protein